MVEIIDIRELNERGLKDKVLRVTNLLQVWTRSL